MWMPLLMCTPPKSPASVFADYPVVLHQLGVAEPRRVAHVAQGCQAVREAVADQPVPFADVRLVEIGNEDAENVRIGFVQRAGLDLIDEAGGRGRSRRGTARAHDVERGGERAQRAVDRSPGRRSSACRPRTRSASSCCRPDRSSRLTTQLTVEISLPPLSSMLLRLSTSRRNDRDHGRVDVRADRRLGPGGGDAACRAGFCPALPDRGSGSRRSRCSARHCASSSCCRSSSIPKVWDDAELVDAGIARVRHRRACAAIRPPGQPVSASTM